MSRMHFRHGGREEPEINLIPFIDVLLVILIFLMLSTTYSKFTEMEVRLPVADTDQLRERPREIVVTVGADGRYAVNKLVLPGRDAEGLRAALAEAAAGDSNSVVIVTADATATHQAVVTVMEAARRAQLMQITFAAQSTRQAGAH